MTVTKHSYKVIKVTDSLMFLWRRLSPHSAMTKYKKFNLATGKRYAYCTSAKFWAKCVKGAGSRRQLGLDQTNYLVVGDVH